MDILLIEDYTDLRLALQDALQRMDHRVTSLSCAEEADAAMAQTAFDLAIVDLNLPGEDGLSLIKRISQTHPDMGIIVLSARNTTLDRVNGYQGGADIYLTKPVIQEELHAAIMAVGRRLALGSAPAAAPPLCSIELDSQALVVRGPSGSARLTTTEFALLAGLTKAEGHVLETPAIYHMLGRSEGRKSALEALVYRVRRKMGEAGAGDNAIRAHRLKGYQLLCPVRIV